LLEGIVLEKMAPEDGIDTIIVSGSQEIRIMIGMYA